MVERDASNVSKGPDSRDAQVVRNYISGETLRTPGTQLLALQAINNLEEQFEALREHAQAVVDEWRFSKRRATVGDVLPVARLGDLLEGLNPASGAGTSSAEGTNEANAAGPRVSSPASERRACPFCEGRGTLPADDVYVREASDPASKLPGDDREGAGGTTRTGAAPAPTNPAKEPVLTPALAIAALEDFVDQSRSSHAKKLAAARAISILGGLIEQFDPLREQAQAHEQRRELNPQRVAVT